MITFDQLPSTPAGEFLYCWKCGGEYSATRGDYFWMHRDRAFTCSAGHRPITLRLVRRESRLIELAS